MLEVYNHGKGMGVLLDNDKLCTNRRRFCCFESLQNHVAQYFKLVHIKKIGVRLFQKNHS